MPSGTGTLLRYIRQLVTLSGLDEASDAALLGRYLSERDEAAFAAIVDRHGPLVLHVCRRVLGDGHDAEDAFQAVFLVLARKAATVRPRGALAAWLHGVARRVALKARSARARRAGVAPLPAASADPRPDPLAELSVRELLLIIDEELQRLAEVYRLPVVLCCLEGSSLEEAARQLGWTLGSVKGRLERGRARLHARLLRRGFTLSAALAAAEVSREAASAAAAARLVAVTAHGVALFAAHGTSPSGISAVAVAWAGDVVKGMAAARLKAAVAPLLVACLLGAGLLTYSVANPPAQAPRDESPLPHLEAPEAPPAGAAVRHQVAAPAGDDENLPVEVRGQVLDPHGKPVRGAKLYVGYSTQRFARDSRVRTAAYPLRTTTGPDGRFRFTFSRSELNAEWLDDTRPAVAAVADGYGPDWVEIGETGQDDEVSLRLVEDLPLDGRILDESRKPVAEVKVRVVDVSRDSEEGVTGFLRRGQQSSWSPRSWTGSLPGLPSEVTTDGDGRFRLTGLGRDRVVRLAIEGPAIGLGTLAAVTRPAGPTPFFGGVKGTGFDHVAQPSRTIRGVVRERATGKPVPGVKVSPQWYLPTAVTDKDGRYELRGCPKASYYILLAQPHAGQPYFAASLRVPDRPGVEAIPADLELVSGIRLQGRVVDQATQKPPQAAVVEYYPLHPNPHSARLTSGGYAASSTLLQADGSYSLVVLPGPGAVCAWASPRHSYAVARLDAEELANHCNDWLNQVNAERVHTATGARSTGVLCVNRYHALGLIRPEEGATSLALDLAVQPARPRSGKVVGPDGKPVVGVRVVGLTAMPEEETLESATFALRGLNPSRSRELFFHHREKGLVKVLTVPGDEAGPLTVRLEPCGSVIGRLVDKSGKPKPGVVMYILHRTNGWLQAKTETDEEGRFRADLVPGEQYRLSLLAPHRLQIQGAGVVGVEVVSGRSYDLGDLGLVD